MAKPATLVASVRLSAPPRFRFHSCKLFHEPVSLVNRNCAQSTGCTPPMNCSDSKWWRDTWSSHGKAQIKRLLQAGGKHGRVRSRWYPGSLKPPHSLLAIGWHFEIRYKGINRASLVHLPRSSSGRIQGCLRSASENGLQRRQITPVNSLRNLLKVHWTSVHSEGYGKEIFILILTSLPHPLQHSLQLLVPTATGHQARATHLRRTDPTATGVATPVLAKRDRHLLQAGEEHGRVRPGCHLGGLEPPHSLLAAGRRVELRCKDFLCGGPVHLSAASRAAVARPLSRFFSAAKLPRSVSCPVAFATSSKSSNNVRTSPSSSVCCHGIFNLILATASIERKKPFAAEHTISFERMVLGILKKALPDLKSGKQIFTTRSRHLFYHLYLNNVVANIQSPQNNRAYTIELSSVKHKFDITL
ncbi:hypothetical protein T265_11199 [Opisthorchis viverrini]|uniref:Uncharacterized protein n=1 Tax=Opisthorchis viverrini TaxID=6198 RepID=A0A074Z3W9_OPIVI|nr:hypothetical protein T265_11199 [Opisthorchis viverrini]KER20192.1 hypothetical protein T265_11199 [Opisthorchis viverrini]